MTETKALSLEKGRIVLPLIILLALLLYLPGCGRNEGSAKEKSKTPAKKTEDKKESEAGIITLSPEKQKIANIEVRTIYFEKISAPLSATAVIELNADKVSKVSSRVGGKINRLMVTQGQRVKAGQPLAYVDSVDLDQVWSEYIKAKGKLDLAVKTFKREETLFDKKVSPEKDVLKARQDLSEAEADLALLKEKFRLFGLEISQFESQRNNGGKANLFIPISSLLGGVVLNKAVTQGEVISQDKVLFTVADLSTLWVLLHFYEKDIPHLKTGMGVRISVAAFPDKIFTGRISYLGDVVDEQSRTVSARVTINNSDGILKPGMFATVLIETKISEDKKTLVVPEDAVMIDGTSHYVFVWTSSEKFLKKDIRVGRTLGGIVEVTEGLKEGDQVVVKGGFTLKSELKKETLEAEK
jgi:membrane fusion protein, heavy metal efflux system